jgi:hypothetical protein
MDPYKAVAGIHMFFKTGKKVFSPFQPQIRLFVPQRGNSDQQNIKPDREVIKKDQNLLLRVAKL